MVVQVICELHTNWKWKSAIYFLNIGGEGLWKYIPLYLIQFQHLHFILAVTQVNTKILIQVFLAAYATKDRFFSHVLHFLIFSWQIYYPNNVEKIFSNLRLEKRLYIEVNHGISIIPSGHKPPKSIKLVDVRLVGGK